MVLMLPDPYMYVLWLGKNNVNSLFGIRASLDDSHS